jgi:hypothetical protein
MRLSSGVFRSKVPRSAITTSSQEYSSTESEKDIALAVAGEHAQPIDPELEARVVRKIDLFLIPAMVIGEIFDLTIRVGIVQLRHQN